jgi:hypothetical protein
MRKLPLTIMYIAAAFCALSAMPTQCPFVDANTGLPCLGVPMPDGVTVAGARYRCSYGHVWIEAN